MIVRENGASLLLITQPDHAALAADLMGAWRGEGLPERPTRDAALFATRHHDLGWAGFDAAPAVDTSARRPFDFMTAPLAVKHAVWQRALAQLPAQSTYAAALVAQHALTVYRRYRPDAAWEAFFLEMEQARDRWFTTDRRPDGSSGGVIDPPLAARSAFLQDYAVVGTGDLLSLVFCNGWTTPHFAEGYAITMAGKELRVAPDPFGGARVPFSVRARRIPRKPYESSADLGAALEAAFEERLEGVAVGDAGLPTP